MRREKILGVNPFGNTIGYEGTQREQGELRDITQHDTMPGELPSPAVIVASVAELATAEAVQAESEPDLPKAS